MGSGLLHIFLSFGFGHLMGSPFLDLPGSCNPVYGVVPLSCVGLHMLCLPQMPARTPGARSMPEVGLEIDSFPWLLPLPQSLTFTWSYWGGGC